MTDPETTQPTPQRNVQQELDVLTAAVEKAAELRLGSFSERNPMLGKMIRCLYCGNRKRKNDPAPCCTAKYFKESEIKHPLRALLGKRRKNPRLSRNRPPLFEMRQKLLELEAEPMLIGPLQDSVQGLQGFWTPQQEVPMHHLAALVEKVILRSKKQKAKKYRDTQKESRRINRRAR